MHSLRFASLVIVLALTGCAATGRTYSEHREGKAQPAADRATLTVYRPGSTQYSARSARIGVDGNTVGNVDHQGFNVFDIAPGGHSLTVDLWDTPGKCTLSVEVLAANEYYFLVSPRLGNLIGALLGGVAGAVAESAGNSCGGAFEIKQVTQDVAQLALPSLRLTE